MKVTVGIYFKKKHKKVLTRNVMIFCSTNSHSGYNYSFFVNHISEKTKDKSFLKN